MPSFDESDPTVTSRIYDVDATDPHSVLVDRAALDPADISHIGDLMAALGRLREADRVLSEQAQEFMKLNSSDMKAILYLIVSENTGTIATAGGIASHLGISSSATTKLLDRLELAGHIRRTAHPHDRRALAITVTPSTHDTATNTVGRQQAKKFHAASRLSAAERNVVIRFLNELVADISEPTAESVSGSRPAQD